jgi:hypothetical protein
VRVVSVGTSLNAVHWTSHSVKWLPPLPPLTGTVVPASSHRCLSICSWSIIWTISSTSTNILCEVLVLFVLHYPRTDNLYNIWMRLRNMKLPSGQLSAASRSVLPLVSRSYPQHFSIIVNHIFPLLRKSMVPFVFHVCVLILRQRRVFKNLSSTRKTLKQYF